MALSVLVVKSPSAKDVRLTEDQVRAAVESSLRSARVYADEADRLLLVSVHIVGGAVSIGLLHLKQLYDPMTGLTRPASTWNDSNVGTHDNDGRFILSGVSDLVDKFLVKYLRANTEACQRQF